MAAPCLPIPCTANADCSGQIQSPGFTSCGQRTSGAFTASNIARTIVETGSPSGPLIGAAVYKLLDTVITRYTDYWQFVLGGILILLVLAFPRGIAGALRPRRPG